MLSCHLAQRFGNGRPCGEILLANEKIQTLSTRETHTGDLNMISQRSKLKHLQNVRKANCNNSYSRYYRIYETDGH